MVDSPNLSLSENKKELFFCGVVEGFYGRPWTTDQRKDLFKKMETWDMGAYVYAPKDDYKHRAYWRDLYTVEEAEHLGSLVTAARARNITFYYALSPGLDITYSNPKEVSTLKRKLDQVASLGCRAFALLFDDIDTEMSEADKERFTSFAHAQVTLTNDVVEHLGERAAGGFLVCPTQYCSTRAIPSVSQSEYLRTLGTQLSPAVDVMWTGPKVISRVIDMEGLEQVTEVLKRKVVIWDNLHANDYDQKRLFLGPYSGRSPALIPKLRGVLTNPNCEYGANFVAIHTLAQWSKCTSEHDAITLPSESSAVSADIRLEQASDGCDATVTDVTESPNTCPSTTSDRCYHPRIALRRAIIEWLPEFSRPKAAQGGGIGTAKPQPQLQLQSAQNMSVLSSVASAAVPSVVTANITAISSGEVQTSSIVPNVLSCGIGIIPSVNTCMGAPVAPLTTTTITCATAPSVPQLTVTVASTAAPVGISGLLTPVSAAASDIVTDGGFPTFLPPTFISTATPLTTGSVPPSLLPVMNSLVSEHSVLPVLATPGNGIITTCGGGGGEVLLPPPPPPPLAVCMNGAGAIVPLADVEPMECGGTTPAMSPTSVATTAVCQPQTVADCTDGPSEEDVPMMPAESSDANSCHMQVEQLDGDSENNCNKSQPHALPSNCPDGAIDALTIADVELLCELFYLPFEHGARGLQLLQDFQWLKSHAQQLEETSTTATPSPDAEEWRKKAAKMEAAAETVARLMRRLTQCPNRELLYDLYAYVWEMRLVVGLLVSYVKWLARGRFASAMSSFTQGSYTWFSKGWKETFMSGEQEPWVFRGGLTADLQRLIPVDSGNDLFVYRAPDVPTTCVHAVRPYIPPEYPPQPPDSESESKLKSDYESLYSVCLHTCADMHFMDESDTLGPTRQYGPGFIGDVTVGAYLQLHPELAMVIENDQDIVGYACAALDYKQFLAKTTQPDGWSDEMKRKYPAEVGADTSALTQQLLDNVHRYCDPESENGGVYTLTSTLYPACITSAVLPRVFEDASVSKRLVTCLLAALRANGVFGAHVLVKKSDTRRLLYFYRLGFQKLPENVPGRNVLGRTF